VTSCVVDCEVVAWDREKECILPFQVCILCLLCVCVSVCLPARLPVSLFIH